MPKTVEELQAELETTQTELTGAKERIRELNGESGGHRTAANREKKARETAEQERDEARGQIERMNTEHAAELDRQRIDLTARSADAERRANETISTYRGRRTDMDLQTAATKLGITDMDGLKLLDRAGLKINAEDGSVENAEEALTAFREAKPYFFAPVPKPGTVTGTTANPNPPPRNAPPQQVDARTMPKAEAAAAEREFLRTLR